MSDATVQRCYKSSQRWTREQKRTQQARCHDGEGKKQAKYAWVSVDIQLTEGTHHACFERREYRVAPPDLVSPEAARHGPVEREQGEAVQRSTRLFARLFRGVNGSRFVPVALEIRFCVSPCLGCQVVRRASLCTDCWQPDSGR